MSLVRNNTSGTLVLHRQAPQKTLIDFPDEILERILTGVVTETYSWHQIVEYLQVCKRFSIIIKGLDRYRVWFTIKNTSLPSEMPLWERLQLERQEVARLGFDGYKALSSDRKNKTEIRYLRSERGADYSMLYILSSSARGFIWTSVNVQEQLESTCPKALKDYGLIFNKNNVFKLINCHPTEEGFIVVLQGGISFWKYDGSGKPQCLSFHSPFTYDRKNKTYFYIFNSTYKNGVLHLTSAMGKDTVDEVFTIDLREKDPQFDKLSEESLPVCDFKLQHSPHGLLLIQHTKDEGSLIGENHICVSKVKIEGSALVEVSEKLIVPGRVVDSINSVWVVDNWILVSRKFIAEDHNHLTYYQKLYIYDTESLKLWLDLEFVTPNSDLHEHFFFLGDFLCLCYVDNTRIIHLPTKKEFTEKLAPLLRHYKPSFAVLYNLHLEQDKTLHALWQTNVLQIIDYQSHNLESIQIPLEKSSFSSPCTNHPKIVIVAGMALALISLISTFVLAFTHPGAVLLQANGFTLTLPTVVTFLVGETFSLVVVGLGIYLYKRKSNDL